MEQWGVDLGGEVTRDHWGSSCTSEESTRGAGSPKCGGGVWAVGEAVGGELTRNN